MPLDIDLNTLLTKEEEKKVEDVLSGKCAISTPSACTEQTMYIFKFQDVWYRYYGDGKNDTNDLIPRGKGDMVKEIIGYIWSGEAYIKNMGLENFLNEVERLREVFHGSIWPHDGNDVYPKSSFCLTKKGTILVRMGKIF